MLEDEGVELIARLGAAIDLRLGHVRVTLSRLDCVPFDTR